jgi:putative FmdB family regulatory protein
MVLYLRLGVALDSVICSITYARLNKSRLDELSRPKTREEAMPRYEFLCEKCKKPFELIMTISEREKTKPTCPTCKGAKVVPQFSGFMAQTAKKS